MAGAGRPIPARPTSELFMKKGQDLLTQRLPRRILRAVPGGGVRSAADVVNANRCIADHLRIASLEQVRAIFDAGEIGVILIGMPGLEKKLARYPQFYSRIGSVREFRPLVAKEAREVLERRWSPPGVCLPQQPLDAETVASIIRITGPCQYLCVNSLSNPVVRFKIAVT